jgi:excisionase family DNA binding protein
MHTIQNNSDLLTTPEACDFLRIKKPTLWDKCRKQEIPHIRYNSRAFRFRKSDLELWLKERSK